MLTLGTISRLKYIKVPLRPGFPRTPLVELTALRGFQGPPRSRGGEEKKREGREEEESVPQFFFFTI